MHSSGELAHAPAQSKLVAASDLPAELAMRAKSGLQTKGKDGGASKGTSSASTQATQSTPTKKDSKETLAVGSTPKVLKVVKKLKV